MAGAYDLALIVRGETMQEIAMFVAKKLSTMDGVVSTGTHFILRRYKDRGMDLLSSDECTDGRSLIL
jgi:DNA-binding Lrp family transcriptional regulator